MIYNKAAQLAKELGINRPSAVADQVNALAPDASTEMRERMMRNIERTWLYVFIADKSFGIVTGRSLIVGWNELPPCPCQWWKKPMTNPSDRMISGIIQIRVRLVSILRVSKKTLIVKLESVGSIEAITPGYQDPRDCFEVALKSLRGPGEHSQRGMLDDRPTSRGLFANLDLLHGSQHHGLECTGNKRTENH